MSDKKNNPPQAAPPPDSSLTDEQRAFVQQQLDDAKFRTRLWGVIKRWVTAILATLLGVTAGWDAIQKVLGHFRGQ